jgi:hypothetical protein
MAQLYALLFSALAAVSSGQTLVSEELQHHCGVQKATLVTNPSRYAMSSPLVQLTLAIAPGSGTVSFGTSYVAQLTRRVELASHFARQLKDIASSNSPLFAQYLIM